MHNLKLPKYMTLCAILFVISIFLFGQYYRLLFEKIIYFSISNLKTVSLFLIVVIIVSTLWVLVMKRKLENFIFILFSYTLVLLSYMLATLFEIALVSLINPHLQISRSIFFLIFGLAFIIVNIAYICLSSKVHKTFYTLTTHLNSTLHINKKSLDNILDILSIITTVILLMNSTFSSINSYDSVAITPKNLDDITEYNLFLYALPIYILSITYKIPYVNKGNN